jgi:hypothetical protein
MQSIKSNRATKFILLAAIFISGTGLIFFQGSASVSAACTYPAQVLNLTNWKETLPTGSSGSPTEIIQTALATYNINPYFHPTSTCDGVVFRAPVNGVTTSGSSYPRSELREMTNNGTTNASWATTSGTHSMFIDEAITAVPETKKHIVAGQIHDASNDVIVIRLEYPKLFIDINGVTGPTLDANYTLGKRFTVNFVAANGQIKIYYNGSATPAYTLNKSDSGDYFKAGAYTQSNCSKETNCVSSNFGEVVIYKLLVQHQSTTITPTPIPTPTPTPTTNGTAFEAEAGTITAPMQVVSSTTASNSKYIVQTTDTGTGSAQYTVAIPTAGKYQLRARVISPNGSSNSFYYALDNNSLSTWDLPDTLTNWTWVNGSSVTLSQGTHTFVVKKREKNTELDAFEFAPVTTTTLVSTAIDGTTPFEAESGTASGGMHVLADTTASGGKYVQADSSGSVSYQVNVPMSGTYRLAGWIKAANGSSDSFYAAIDGSSTVTWTLVYPTTAWTYNVDNSHTFTLSAGVHTLTLKYREAGAKIDRVVLVKQ